VWFGVNVDINRTTQLIRFIVLAAGQSDEFADRLLGPIHLIKYLYLADLAYAGQNNGQTFTGITWRFHHFGPWAVEAFQQLEPALAIPGAKRTTFESQYGDDDVVRWQWCDDQEFKTIERALPLAVAFAVKKAVHEYGSDTYMLLHEVYRTPPMLHAAPEEELDFKWAIPACRGDLDNVKDELMTSPTHAQPLSKKARQRRIAELRERVQKKLHDSIDNSKLVSADPPPRYDQVFIDGQQWLDEIDGGPVPEQRGELTFSSEVWKHPGRTEPNAG
jgi:hypothetical protein